MRTDVQVSTRRKLRCKQIPSLLSYRPNNVGRGDYIEWRGTGDSLTFRGRVIGVVTNPDDGQDMLVVAMQMLSGCVCERWVSPDWVIDTAPSSPMYCEKAEWLYGDGFLKTSTDKARDAFRYTVAELGAKQ